MKIVSFISRAKAEDISDVIWQVHEATKDEGPDATMKYLNSVGDTSFYIICDFLPTEDELVAYMKHEEYADEVISELLSGIDLNQEEEYDQYLRRRG